MKSFEIEVHGVRAGDTCGPIEVGSGCRTGGQIRVEIWNLIHEVRCSLEIIVPSCLGCFLWHTFFESSVKSQIGGTQLALIGLEVEKFRQCTRYA